MLQAHFYLIGISMQEEKYDVTLAALKKQDQTFKMTYKDFTTVPAYAGFVKSTQYQQWLEYLAQKGKGQSPAPSRTKSRLSKIRNAGSGT